MNLKEYQEQAKRTCPTLGNDKLDLAHMVLGMGSELNELDKAIFENDEVNKSEELSDIFWYIANYCTFRGFDLNEIYQKSLKDSLNLFGLNHHISELQDIVKKYVAYNKPLQNFEEKSILEDIVVDLINDYNNIDMLKSLDNNIAKLKVRFPEKFTEENALNRNLEAERIELEK